MEDKMKLRAPVSQKSHVVPIPEHPEYISGEIAQKTCQFGRFLP